MEFEAPADAWAAWLGVAAVGVAVTGAALAVPTAPPPDADAAADAVDRVAAEPVDATATYDHDADEVLFDRRRIALRNDRGADRASVAFGMTPARDHEGLAAVLDGTAPDEAFADVDAFADAVSSARSDATEPSWRPSSGELRVRSLTWGEHRVTLVDA